MCDDFGLYGDPKDVLRGRIAAIYAELDEMVRELDRHRPYLDPEDFEGIAHKVAVIQDELDPDCTECGKNPKDYPSNLCVGCDAYKDHQS